MKVYRSSLITQFLITVLLVMVLITLPAAGGVKAQNQTLLMLEPTSASTGVDGLVPLTVKIIGGQDLIAYDLTIQYDAQVVALESWAHGSYFKQLAVIRNDNQPGSLRLAATQVGAPAVSGDGTILTLVFRGMNTGASAVKLMRADLVTTSGQLANVVTSDGEIVVSSNVSPSLEPTFTSTATATATRTLTPTLTRTIRVPTATRTATISLVVNQTQADAAQKTAIMRSATVAGVIKTKTPAAGASQKTATRPGSPSLTDARPAVGLTTMQSGNAQSPAATTQPAAIEGESSGQGVLNSILWVAALFLLALLIGMVYYYLKNRK